MVSAERREATGRVATNKMGLLGAISYILGNIVGSGIFVAPTTILDKTQSAGLSLVIWAVAALISMLGALCYVELGTEIRVSGADYAYLCYVKWYPIAFAFMIVGCMFNFPATTAIQAQTFSEYIFKGFKVDVPNETAMYFAKKLIAFAVIWLITFINFFSLKTFVSRFQIAATFAKVAVTAIVVATGFYFLIVKGETQNISDPFKGTQFSVGATVLALYAGLYSYDGWDVLNFGAEELEKPKRNMPLAIIIGIFLTATIYIAANISFFAVLSVGQILHSDAVASTFAAEKLGEFQYAVPFLICVLLVGSINGTIFSASRFLYAAAREGHLPTFISCSNQENNSPRAAIFFNVALSVALSFIGDLDRLITYSGFSLYLQRICTMAVLLWIRLRRVPTHPDSIRIPIIIPIAFLLICVALAAITIVNNADVAVVGLTVLTGGFLLYYLFIYERSLSAFKWYQKYSVRFNNSTTIIAQIIFNAMPERSIQDDARKMVGELRKQQQACVEAKNVTKEKKVKRWYQRRENTVIDSKNFNGPPPKPGSA